MVLSRIIYQLRSTILTTRHRSIPKFDNFQAPTFSCLVEQDLFMAGIPPRKKLLPQSAAQCKSSNKNQSRVICFWFGIKWRPLNALRYRVGLSGCVFCAFYRKFLDSICAYWVATMSFLFVHYQSAPAPFQLVPWVWWNGNAHFKRCKFFAQQFHISCGGLTLSHTVQ